MISLDRIRICTNPQCRLVLPADPDNPENAGFWVNAYDANHRVKRWKGQCKDCVRERRRRSRNRRNNRVYEEKRDGKTVKLKICRRCGLEKICSTDPDSEFAIASRKLGYSVVWDAACKACKNARHKHRMATDPEYAQRVRQRGRVRNQEWLKDPENRARAQAACRRYYRKVKEEDPGRWAAEARMDYVLRCEREGKTVNPSRPTIIDRTAPRVPIGPFYEWVLACKEVFGISEAEALAGRLDICPRRMQDFLSGKNKNVTIDIVDRAILAADISVEVGGQVIYNLECLYPADLYPLREG
jgi:hypothetical protein